MKTPHFITQYPWHRPFEMRSGTKVRKVYVHKYLPDVVVDWRLTGFPCKPIFRISGNDCVLHQCNVKISRTNGTAIEITL